MRILNKNSIFAIVLSLAFVAIIYFLGYKTPRENFEQFILLFIASFAIFYGLSLNKQQWNIKTFIVLAIISRLVLLLAAPELSNDFYRFIWDGELITRGINPYAHTPNDLISQGPIYADGYMRMLYHGMGDLSQENYSCYPVFNQLLFYVPASLSDSIYTNVIILKLIIILADIGAIYIGIKILKLLGKSTHLIWFYALNPFVILEFTGNIHFEGVMIFFILLAIYYVLLDKWLMAAIFFGIAIQIKLIPLILLPFLLKKLKWKRSVGFVAMCAIVVLSIGTLMLSDAFLDNMMVSINLYFSKFEFNASIFYLLRAYSFSSVGYDDIARYGPLLAKYAAIGIGVLAVIKSHKNNSSMFTGMLFALVIYYALATTVHPWYIGLILVFSIFTKYKFGLIWSLMVMLSYYAYSNSMFEENLTLVFIEYVLVFGIMLFEICRNTKKDDFGVQIKSFFTD